MTDPFTVLTFNVGNGRAAPARLSAMLRASGADIVALQELSDLQADGIEESLADAFPHRAVFPGGFAGKAILSRFPILRAEQLHLSDERPDLMARLEVGSRELTIISAHPPPPRPSWRGVRFNENTAGQIKSLAGLTQANAPAILLGDFNLTDSLAEYAYMRSTGLQDAFNVSGRGRGYTLPRRLGPWKRNLWLNGLLRWIPMLPVARVDFIWYTGHLESLDSWVGADAGSDHMPVLAKMGFLRVG